MARGWLMGPSDLSAAELMVFLTTSDLLDFITKDYVE